MSPQHRRYLVFEQGIGAGVVNLALNAAIAWLLFRGAATVPLWGQQSIGGDTIGTTFLLPFITTLIASRIVRGHVRSGRVPALAWSEPSMLRRLPAGLAGRGAVLGLACIVLVGVPATFLLGSAGVGAMTFRGFVAFKALFAAALAMVVTPLIARAALADPV
ncbi:MAG: hypothetical protein ACREQL_15675 [Candidatus Binatia bacterium]